MFAEYCSKLFTDERRHLQVQGVTIMGYTIINQIGYAGLLLHIYSLPPIHLMCIFQLFMSFPATTRLPRLMRARDHAYCEAL
jgi:hypothetical protein